LKHVFPGSQQKNSRVLFVSRHNVVAELLQALLVGDQVLVNGGNPTRLTGLRDAVVTAGRPVQPLSQRQVGNLPRVVRQRARWCAFATMWLGVGDLRPCASPAARRPGPVPPSGQACPAEAFASGLPPVRRVFGLRSAQGHMPWRHIPFYGGLLQGYRRTGVSGLPAAAGPLAQFPVGRHGFRGRFGFRSGRSRADVAVPAGKAGAADGSLCVRKLP
jgi:hypothetical protein